MNTNVGYPNLAEPVFRIRNLAILNRPELLLGETAIILLNLG